MLSPSLVGGHGCRRHIEGWSWVGVVVEVVMLVAVVGVTTICDGRRHRPSMQVAGWSMVDKGHICS